MLSTSGLCQINNGELSSANSASRPITRPIDWRKVQEGDNEMGKWEGRGGKAGDHPSLHNLECATIVSVAFRKRLQKWKYSLKSQKSQFKIWHY